MTGIIHRYFWPLPPTDSPHGPRPGCCSCWAKHGTSPINSHQRNTGQGQQIARQAPAQEAGWGVTLCYGETMQGVSMRPGAAVRAPLCCSICCLTHSVPSRRWRGADLGCEETTSRFAANCKQDCGLTTSQKVLSLATLVVYLVPHIMWTVISGCWLADHLVISS